MQETRKDIRGYLLGNLLIRLLFCYKDEVACVFQISFLKF